MATEILKGESGNMPKIIEEKNNEKYIATLHKQSESEYYQGKYEAMVTDFYRYQNMNYFPNENFPNENLRNLVNSLKCPTEKEIQESMYEFYNDMLDAETMIMLMIYTKRNHHFRDESANAIIRYMKYSKELRKEFSK